MATTEFNALEFSDESLTSFIFHLINDAVVIFENCFFTSNILGLFLIFCVMLQIDDARIKSTDLQRFILSVREAMPSNPYHNWAHVVDVTQAKPSHLHFLRELLKSATAHRQQRSCPILRLDPQSADGPRSGPGQRHLEPAARPAPPRAAPRRALPRRRPPRRLRSLPPQGRVQARRLVPRGPGPPRAAPQRPRLRDAGEPAAGPPRRTPHRRTGVGAGAGARHRPGHRHEPARRLPRGDRGRPRRAGRRGPAAGAGAAESGGGAGLPPAARQVRRRVQRDQALRRGGRVGRDGHRRDVPPRRQGAGGRARGARAGAGTAARWGVEGRGCDGQEWGAVPDRMPQPALVRFRRPAVTSGLAVNMQVEPLLILCPSLRPPLPSPSHPQGPRLPSSREGEVTKGAEDDRFRVESWPRRSLQPATGGPTRAGGCKGPSSSASRGRCSTWHPASFPAWPRCRPSCAWTSQNGDGSATRSCCSRWSAVLAHDTQQVRVCQYDGRSQSFDPYIRATTRSPRPERRLSAAALLTSSSRLFGNSIPIHTRAPQTQPAVR